MGVGGGAARIGLAGQHPGKSLVHAALSTGFGDLQQPLISVLASCIEYNKRLGAHLFFIHREPLRKFCFF